MKLRNILVGALLAASCTLFAQETVYKFTKVVEKSSNSRFEAGKASGSAGEWLVLE